MKFYAIIYDLRQPGRKYNELYDAIKTYAGDDNWQHPMESFWVVAFSNFNTEVSADSIHAELRKHIDNNDSIIVCKLDISDMQGWMPKSLWTWIKDKQPIR